MQTRRHLIASMLGMSLALMALAACGSGTPSSKGEATTPPTTNPAIATSTTLPSPGWEPGPAAVTTDLPSPTTSEGPGAVEDDDVAELDPMLAEIDELLAELNLFVNETAFVVGAEEGGFTP